MNRKSWMCALMVAWMVHPVGSQAAEMTPKEILDKVDDLYRGSSAHGTMGMKVVTEHWTREMRIEFWSKGKEKSLMKILAPKKEKGTATLKSGNNIWNYLPKVKRTIKVPSSMMGGSWMGSHFTNDDIVKESRMTEDYTFELTFQGKRDGLQVVEIACTPRPEAAVVWGRVLVLVREDILQPVWIKYFDEDMELARTMTFYDVKRFGDRDLPSRSKMVPADKPAEYTRVVYDQVRFDVEVPDSLFTLRNLQR